MLSNNWNFSWTVHTVCFNPKHYTSQVLLKWTCTYLRRDFTARFGDKEMHSWERALEGDRGVTSSHNCIVWGLRPANFSTHFSPSAQEEYKCGILLTISWHKRDSSHAGRKKKLSSETKVWYYSLLIALPTNKKSTKKLMPETNHCTYLHLEYYTQNQQK